MLYSKIIKLNAFGEIVEIIDNEGKEIEYTIREHEIEDYLSNILDLTPNTGTFGPTIPKTFEIINTYKAPRKINFIVKKVWDDKNNKYGLRPSSIEVEIYGVETAEATSGIMVILPFLLNLASLHIIRFDIVSKKHATQ